MAMCENSIRILIMKAAAALLSIVVAFSLMLPASAFADVRKSDIVGGLTLEERGLPPALSPSASANHVYVIDSEGKVYFERDADARTNIASITKVMTAIIALENCELDEMLTVSEEAAHIGESSSYLMAGDVLSIENALMGLMVPSGNDAAQAIGEYVGGKILQQARSKGETMRDAKGNEITGIDASANVEAFVAKMNEKAAELGLENTLFTNPHGLDIGKYAKEMYSSARDVAQFCEYAMQNPTFRDIAKMPSATFTVKRNEQDYAITVDSTDVLIDYYKGACGIKTGYTQAAGACFAGACNRDGKYLYAIVLDSTTEERRFEDAVELFDWVYNSQIDYRLANSSETVESQLEDFEGEVPVIAHASLVSWIDRTVPVTFANPNATINISKINGNISQDIQIDEINGGVSAGQVVGTATFYQGNKEVGKQDIVAAIDAPAPNIFESVGIAFQRLAGAFSGASQSADTVICNEMPLLLEKK